ncbi:MAG: RNA-guided endonuclease InsQ/TnpB family protein [Candidatus Sericytochromatia bacterium]
MANKNGECFLKFTIRHQVPASSASEQVLGVDLGIRNLASLSTGERFGGTETDGLRRRFQKVRSSLQRKGTKGAKRVLKRLSGREKRYMAWVNHTISARIVRYARHHEMAVAMEDLTGIRTRARLGKCQRKALHRWAFRQIRSFIMYKSLLAGVALILVNPAFTSQTCHRCHHIGTRQADSFRCGHCGYKGHADYNGAKNIALLGACVTRPEHSLVCPLMGR